jgi:hypothetical protein
VAEVGAWVVGGVVGGWVVVVPRCTVVGGLVVLGVGALGRSCDPSVPRGRRNDWPVLGSTSAKMSMIVTFFSTTAGCQV